MMKVVIVIMLSAIIAILRAVFRENARLKTGNAELIERAKWNAREQRKHNDKMREENELILKIVRHQKYNRCLAMAEWCDAEADVADADGCYEEMRWYQKWHKRWLEIADKFKEDA